MLIPGPPVLKEKYRDSKCPVSVNFVLFRALDHGL